MDRLLNFFKFNNLDIDDKTFVLAVSTGIDSSVLLDMFLKLKEKFSFNLVVCHVNHHKRLQSIEEAYYITKYCEDNNLKLFIKDLYFDEVLSNFQAVARDERYRFFEEVIKNVNADYLVLAHHATDNTETVLMRMLRGSSLKGYAGIIGVNEVCKKDLNYKIIRPLINFSRIDIINYQQENNVFYFEDISNSSDDYFRNRIRHNVYPVLKEYTSDLDKKINEFSNVLYQASLIVDEKRDSFINDKVKTKNGEISFLRNEFLLLSNYLQEEVLFELLKPFSLSKANILELIKIIHSKNRNYRIYFKKLFDFCIDYDMIVISTNHFENNNLKDFSLIITNTGNYIYDDFVINVTNCSDNLITKSNEMCYNIDSLPIILRTRRNGDKIKLKCGYKKVNDLFIDLKISKDKRDKILLAVDQSKEVLMIFGVRKSEILKEINKNLNLKNTIKITLEEK